VLPFYSHKFLQLTPEIGTHTFLRPAVHYTAKFFAHALSLFPQRQYVKASRLGFDPSLGLLLSLQPSLPQIFRACYSHFTVLDHLQFMQIALAEANAAAKAGEVPIGAVLVQSETVIAKSGNRTIRDTDPTAHAEIVVLREASRLLGNYRVADTTLYVTLEPCAMCAGAMIQARISHLVYAADDPKGGAFRSCFEILSSPKLNHQVSVTPGILADESAALLRNFFAARR
jgi:tRNA(adenine34) deaminase